MAIDWKLYEGDVNRWYLDEGKTANEVIQLLLERHNLVVTTRQFKAKFNGCKKISSKEWSILIPKLREREANGLKSVIYVCGKAIKQETVTRSMRRYSKLCRSGSQSDTNIDLGIDTIGEHRIEIRTQSHSGCPTETRPSHRGDHNPGSQGNELDIDEEFGLAHMGVELSAPASAETAIFPSPSIFLRGLDRLPLDPSEIFPLESANEISMTTDEQALPSSQWSLSSPASLASWFPFGHTFTCFWDIPEISSSTLSGCQVLGLATQLGIFVPDHGQNDLLPNLNLTTVQTETLKPIVQSIKELIKTREPSPWQHGVQASDHFSPNLLDIADTQSLCQAMSVIVYMVSNNLLGWDESFRLMVWLVERGHASKLLSFSRLPTVDHLEFGFAFLRAICKAANGFTPHFRHTRLVDFISSREFLNLVKSHRGDLSSPLGIELFRLAITVDSMQLATLLVSHGVDFKSCSSPRDHWATLGLAISLQRNSMLEYLTSLGVGVNADFPGGPALVSAIKIKDQFAIQTLLNAGIQIGEENRARLEDAIFQIVDEGSAIISTLQEKRPDLNNLIVCRKLVNAAHKGNRELSKVSLTHGIVSQQVLEHAMCRAIESDDLAATRTFLQRGTDPNVGMATFRDCLDGSTGRNLISHLVDMFYALVQAGAQITEETALSVQHFFDLYLAPSDNDDDEYHLLLLVLLQSGYDEVWVHQYLLTFWAHKGSIFECDTWISKGASINGYGLQGHSALKHAAGNDHLALVQHLISRGADPNLPPNNNYPNGETALYAALANGCWEVVAYLVDSGADVTTEATTMGVTLVEGLFVPPRDYHKADKEVNAHLRYLLALGAPVSRPNGSDSFLLHGLLGMGQTDCLELVLRAGSRIEDKCRGITPIQLAVSKKDPDHLRILLAHGANINGCPVPVGNRTPASEMPSQTPMEIPRSSYWTRAPFKRLYINLNLACGFAIRYSVDDKPYFPHTPLQIASSSHDPDLSIIEFLLSQGADINAPAAEWYGRTALQASAAARKLDMDIVKLLLDRGADVNAPPARVGGVTALQGAVTRGNIQLVNLLLRKGADINAIGAPEEGRTALEGAAEHGRMEMLRFLLSKGAIPNLATGYSRAIELAEKEMHFGIVRFLRGEQRKLREMGFLGINLDSLC